MLSLGIFIGFTYILKSQFLNIHTLVQIVVKLNKKKLMKLDLRYQNDKKRFSIDKVFR